jgi:hypothetical protein
MGHLDPTRTTTTRCLLLWLQRCWEQEWGRRKAILATRTQMHTKISLSLVTKCWEWFWTWERIWSLVCVLEWSLELLYWMQWLKTWMPWMVVVGGIYSPNHQTNRWGWATVDGRTGHCPVRQPRHQPLGFWQFRPLELWHLGAPDSPVPHQTHTVHCPVRYWRLLWLLPRTVALSGHCAVDRCADSRCSAWCTGQSGDTPDSPVNYSGVRLEKPEGEEFEVDPPWCTGQSVAPDQGPLRFLLLLSFEP